MIAYIIKYNLFYSILKTNFESCQNCENHKRWVWNTYGTPLSYILGPVQNMGEPADKAQWALKQAGCITSWVYKNSSHWPVYSGQIQIATNNNKLPFFETQPNPTQKWGTTNLNESLCYFHNPTFTWGKYLRK